MKNIYKSFIKRGYDVAYIALQGSQNYGLDMYTEEYMSDIDTKAIIVPSLNDILTNRKLVSETVVLENNEHIDVKDIRAMFETFKKQNINFIEILFTPYHRVPERYLSEIKRLLNSAELIARLNKKSSS